MRGELMMPNGRINKVLATFECRYGEFSLVTFEDGGCAALLNGRPLESCQWAPSEFDRGVETFCKLYHACAPGKQAALHS